MPRIIKSTVLVEFCSQDVVAAKIEYWKGGVKTEMIVVSAYLPYDSLLPRPSRELVEIVQYAESKGLGLIVGCDANAQNTVWGSH